jgi:hypothetical protein
VLELPSLVLHWVTVVYEVKAEDALRERASSEPGFGMVKICIKTRLDFQVNNDSDIPSLPSNLSFSTGASASFSLPSSSPLPLYLRLSF